MAEIIPDTTTSVNKRANEEIENPCKDNVSSHLDSQVKNEIVSTKIENVHSTPNNVDNSQDFNDTNCINEDTKSPHKNTFNQEDLLKNSLFKSPVFKKSESAQFADTSQTNACLKRKRTNSADSNYDVFKSELNNVENPCKDNVPSHLDSQVKNEIVSTKIENVHSTPNNVDNSQDFNSTNSTNEDTKSPHKNTFNQEDLLKNPSFKSPVFKKSESAQFADTAQTNACIKRKRTNSADSNYDVFKSELNNVENFNNFEDINLLHDLDSIIKFENSQDVFLSSMMDSVQDDSLLGMNKDPATDPLSISDCEKKDSDTIANSRFNKKHKSPVKLKSQIKRQKSKHHFKKKKHELNVKEELVLKKLKNFEEWEKMPLIDIKKLLELRIKLKHKVPSQHKIELSGSHAPTKKEKILFQKYGPIRKGSYTPIEDKIIRNNWKMFCKLHDWDVKRAEPFLYWRHNGRYYIKDVKERQKFVQFLANGLPWRTLYSVYSRFKILYRKKITYTRYTSKEDEKILTYIQNKNLDERDTKFSELAKLLRRTGRSVFKRYQYLKKQIQDKSEMESLVDIRWTLPLIKKFIQTLLNVTLSDDIRELKDATLPKSVWQKMEKKLNIHENVLRTFWQHQLHLQLFSTYPIYLNDIKIQLIEYMYAKGISNTREIIWPNVAQYFDGATAVFLCKVFFYLVQECNMNDVHFADVVEYLYHTKIPEIQKAPTDKFLPKIIYTNEKVSLLDIESNKTITAYTDHQDHSTESTDN